MVFEECVGRERLVCGRASLAHHPVCPPTLQVLLRMCEPFMGMHSHKAWPRLEPRYLSDPEARASLALDETRVAATEPEVAAWLATWRPAGAQGDQAAAGAGPAPTTSGYHFIADVFFMTARSLGVGYAKTIDNLKSFGRRLQNYEDAVAELEGQLQRMPQHPLIQTRLRQYQGIIRQIKGSDGAYQAALLNPSLISNVLSFYQYARGIDACGICGNTGTQHVDTTAH